MLGKISNTEDLIHIKVNTHGSACQDQVKIDQRSEMTIQQKKSIAIISSGTFEIDLKTEQEGNGPIELRAIGK